MNTVHIENIDLNLLRVFDAVYRAGNVSRAAEALGLTQPAASHALTRLRLLLRDPLFVRAPGGVQPTPRADRLAAAVGSALGTLAQALDERDHFVAAESRQIFRLHMSDIGEARFLPAVMAALRQQAPGVQLQTLPLAARARRCGRSSRSPPRWTAASSRLPSVFCPACVTPGARPCCMTATSCCCVPGTRCSGCAARP